MSASASRTSSSTSGASATLALFAKRSKSVSPSMSFTSRLLSATVSMRTSMSALSCESLAASRAASSSAGVWAPSGAGFMFSCIFIRSLPMT